MIASYTFSPRYKLKNDKLKIAIFPENPYDFNPIGCTRTVFPGTKNGKIIEWRYEQVVVFSWDEDFRWESHYHVMPFGIGDKPHYRLLMLVPYPYNKIFF